MIRVVLIEDEEGSRNALKQILRNYIQDLEIVGEADNVKDGVALINKTKPDLLFMDIHLPDGESFDILDQLDLNQFDFDIIFITAYPNVKVKAFDYFFLQYLNKPYNIDKIEKAIDHYKKKFKNKNHGYEEILEEIRSNNDKIIPISHTNGVDFIKVENIVRLEAQRNYTAIHCTEKGEFLSSKNIKTYENLLDPKKFFRVHKSHIIHLDYLKSIDNDGSIIMKEGSRVPLAHRMRKEFLDSFK